MTDKFRASEASEWNSHGHMGRGKVRRKLAGRTLLKGHAYLGEEGQAPSLPPPQAAAEAPEAASEPSRGEAARGSRAA